MHLVQFKHLWVQQSKIYDNKFLNRATVFVFFEIKYFFFEIKYFAGVHFGLIFSFIKIFLYVFHRDLEKKPSKISAC